MEKKIINVIEAVSQQIVGVKNFIISDHKTKKDAMEAAEMYFWRCAKENGADEADKFKIMVDGEYQNLDYKISIIYGK